MVIYLDRYRQAKASVVDAAKFGACGVRTMRTNSTPAVVYMFSNLAQRTISPELPSDLTMVDMDKFLCSVYGPATQI